MLFLLGVAYLITLGISYASAIEPGCEPHRISRLLDVIIDDATTAKDAALKQVAVKTTPLSKLEDAQVKFAKAQENLTELLGNPSTPIIDKYFAKQDYDLAANNLRALEIEEQRVRGSQVLSEIITEKRISNDLRRPPVGEVKPADGTKLQRREIPIPDEQFQKAHQEGRSLLNLLQGVQPGEKIPIRIGAKEFEIVDVIGTDPKDQKRLIVEFFDKQTKERKEKSVPWSSVVLSEKEKTQAEVFVRAQHEKVGREFLQEIVSRPREEPVMDRFRELLKQITSDPERDKIIALSKKREELHKKLGPNYYLTDEGSAVLKELGGLEYKYAPLSPYELDLFKAADTEIPKDRLAFFGTEKDLIKKLDDILRDKYTFPRELSQILERVKGIPKRANEKQISIKMDQLFEINGKSNPYRNSKADFKVRETFRKHFNEPIKDVDRISEILSQSPRNIPERLDQDLVRKFLRNYNKPELKVPPEHQETVDYVLKRLTLYQEIWGHIGAL